MKRFAIILLLLAPSLAFADSIARGARSTGTFDNGGTNTTFTDSVTITGSNTVAIECIYFDKSSGATLNGVKIGSSQMTQVNTVTPGSGFAGQLYYLMNPPTGAQTVTASSTAAFSAGSKQFAMVTMQYTGVSQVSTPDSNNTKTQTASVNPFTISTTVAVASGAWLSGCASDDQGTISGAGTGTTLWGSAAGNMHPADSNGTVGTGSQSLNWATTGSTADFTANIVSLAPATAAPTTGITSILGLVSALWIY